MTIRDDDGFPEGPLGPLPPAPGGTALHGSPPKGHPRARRMALRWGPVLAWLALIFALSAQAGLRVSDDPAVDSPIRHVAHVAVYAVLAVLLLRAISAGVSGSWTVRVAAVAVVLATLYGVTDEVHQTYVPERTGHLVDVGWDLLGALLGVALTWVVPRRWPRLLRRRASDSARPD